MNGLGLDVHSALGSCCRWAPRFWSTASGPVCLLCGWCLVGHSGPRGAFLSLGASSASRRCLVSGGWWFGLQRLSGFIGASLVRVSRCLSVVISRSGSGSVVSSSGVLLVLLGASLLFLGHALVWFAFCAGAWGLRGSGSVRGWLSGRACWMCTTASCLVHPPGQPRLSLIHGACFVCAAGYACWWFAGLRGRHGSVGAGRRCWVGLVGAAGRWGWSRGALYAWGCASPTSGLVSSCA